MSKQSDVSSLKDNKMRSMPIGRLLFTMAMPLAMSMLIQALYNVVDSLYVSRISESAVTAISLAFPVQNLLIGFATGIAVGVNSLLSKSLGEGNQRRANTTAGNGIFLTAIAIGLFMLFGILGARPYYTMQSTVEETVRGGTSYISICCIFSIGIFTEVLGERLLQSSGHTIYTLYTQGTGAILNILLDPIFIFGVEPLGIPAMGITGAAVATVIGQWVAAIMAIIFNIYKNKELHFSAAYLRPNGEIMKMILMVGVPSIIMMAIGSIMNFGMNQIFLGFQDYGETAAGVFGVYFRLQSFVFMPLFGLNNATISIAAYNYGAKQPQRITKTLKLSVATALVITLTGLAVFQIFTDPLMNLFDPSPEFLALGRSALRIVSLHFPLAALSIVLGASFQALGNGIYTTIMSLCRQLVVLLPAAYLLSLTGNVHNVWWAFPIAEVVGAALALLFFAKMYRSKIKPLFA